jgi:hypothetical protein
MIATPSPLAIHTIDLRFQRTRAIHVIAVITAQGENMISTTEQTETATETKATKKAARGARRANVSPAKGKAGKKASPKKKALRSARNDAREGTKTATILEMLKRPGGATAKELLKPLAGSRIPCAVFFWHGRKENGAHRYVHQGRGRGAGVLPESLSR